MAEAWRRVVVPAARLSGWLERFAAQHGDGAARRIDDGVELIAPDGQRAVLTAAFPDDPADGPPADGPPADDPLQTLIANVARERRVGVLLIRRGGYGIGVYSGARLVASKVGASYVQGTTKAGGWSQQRYARRRDNQTRGIVQKAVEDAVRVLDAQPGAADALDATLVGGDRALIRAALEDARLRRFADRVREPFLAVGDPRLATLQDLADQIGAVRIALLP